MIYWVKGDIYKNEPLSFLLDDSEIKETIAPYFMARIVDVKEFLQEYPFYKQVEPFYFEVSDPVADWNNGVFAVSWDEAGQVQVSNQPIGHKVKLSIQTLTCLLMNYRRASYLARIERLEADKETIQLLEETLPDMEAYFSDYF